MISVIIPAYNAEATLGRAIRSLLVQTLTDWQAIIVADDGLNYHDILASQGISDPRLIFTSTGGVGTGCHNARNKGFPLAKGEYVTQLDADDTLTPTRFSELVPLAQHYGAAADNLLMIDDETEAPVGTTLGSIHETTLLTLSDFMRLNAPLVPLIRSDHVLSRVIGVEFSEDVIANMQLIDRIGKIPVTLSSSYIYRIRIGSVANSKASVKKFDDAYSEFITRLERGDGFKLLPINRKEATDGMITKKQINLAYENAIKKGNKMSFAVFSKNYPLSKK